MFEDYPTKSDAQEQATEKTESLDRLINPSDVQDDADSWDEVDDEKLEVEGQRSAEVMTQQTGRYGVKHLIQDRAFRIWTDSFTRIVDRDMCDHLRDEYSNEELIFDHGIWLGDVDKWEAYEVCHQVFEDPSYQIPQWAYNQAREEVSKAVFDATIDL